MNVGLLGCGVIGGGVLELIDNLPKEKNVKLLKVFDLPIKKDILKERFASDALEICENKDIDVVIEAMGGNDFPYNCIKTALKNKKHVITSNKEVVSLHIEEFYNLAKENGVFFMCEASVGGGIPLICSLIDSVKVDSVDHVYGIINGTTNYILTRMQKDGVSLEEALDDAKKLGFAERDATADLEGLDMTRKICILSSIAYGGVVNYSDVYHYGITNLTKEILKDINSLGYNIKFIAESKLNGSAVQVSVEPVLITSENPLNGVSYEFNAVYFNCKNNGLLGFYGKGAGRFPTASAMVNDLVRISDLKNAYYFKNEKAFKVINFKNESKYYVYDGVKGKIINELMDASNYKFVARIF